MSLELKLTRNGNSDDGDSQFLLPGGDLQGFVCFTWTSPFHKYVDYCNLIKIQVTLEGYLVTNPSNKLSIGKKFYTSEILNIRDIYGTEKLGHLFPKRSFYFPFIVRPNQPQHMIPSCRSAKLMNVAYRLKTRVVLRDCGQQRTPDQAYTSFTHHLAFEIKPSPTPNASTQEAIQQAQRIEASVNKLVRASADAFQIRASLSDPVAKISSTGAIEALVRLDQFHRSSKPVSKLTGTLIQECAVEEGVVLKKKVEVFNIRLLDNTSDRCNKNNNRIATEELSIPFNLPVGLLPTLIEKDNSAKVSYHIEVGACVGKKKQCCVSLPLIVVH